MTVSAVVSAGVGAAATDNLGALNMPSRKSSVTTVSTSLYYWRILRRRALGLGAKWLLHVDVDFIVFVATGAPPIAGRHGPTLLWASEPPGLTFRRAHRSVIARTRLIPGLEPDISRRAFRRLKGDYPSHLRAMLLTAF